MADGTLTPAMPITCSFTSVNLTRWGSSTSWRTLWPFVAVSGAVFSGPMTDRDPRSVVSRTADGVAVDTGRFNWDMALHMMTRL